MVFFGIMLRYQEQSPSASLHPFVQTLWTFTAPANQPEALYALPPDACLSLAVAQGEADAAVMLVGPHPQSVAVSIGPGARVHGVRMRPEAAGLLANLDPQPWVGCIVPLSLAAPTLATQLTPGWGIDDAFAELLAVLESRAPLAPPPDALVRKAVAAIEAAQGTIRMTALAQTLGVSTRTLQRRFAKATGLTPKAFARVRRFLLAAANVLRAEPEAWGRIAAEHGFADQAHFTRECAALTGATPTAFAVSMQHIQHIDVHP